MAISGVGTVYNYNYNLVSKRISGADGKNDIENQAADRFMGALNSLLHFADS